ncbi:MAG: ABC transporter permease subunit [Chloroflexi bacterium]|nr:ABC transporter permease subunit [Chloroflexota bacterium]
MREQILAELMKSRTRWLPYVLLAVLLLGAGVQVWLFGYTMWWSLRNEADPQLRSDLPELIRGFALPWALPALLDAGQFWGSMIVGVFIASGIATEYNWGTARQAISRGQSRNQWLTMKLLGLALFCAILLLAALAFGVVSMLWTSSLAGYAITLDPPGAAHMTVFDVAIVILRAGFGVLPYALLAFAITVIGRSTALGSTGIILFVIIEGTLNSIFGALGGTWADIRTFSIEHNVSSLLAANRVDDGQYLSIAFRESPRASELPDPWVAFFVLCAWCVALLVVTYYVFNRRDLRLGTGE